MKKILILIMIVAIIVAFYEQVSPDRNVYVTVIAIVIFMYGMMRLSAKTPSKNQEKEDEDA
jgi:L-asparagine transporter-like permease